MNLTKEDFPEHVAWICPLMKIRLGTFALDLPLGSVRLGSHTLGKVSLFLFCLGPLARGTVYWNMNYPSENRFGVAALGLSRWTFR